METIIEEQQFQLKNLAVPLKFVISKENCLSTGYYTKPINSEHTIYFSQKSEFDWSDIQTNGILFVNSSIEFMIVKYDNDIIIISKEEDPEKDTIPKQHSQINLWSIKYMIFYINGLHLPSDQKELNESINWRSVKPGSFHGNIRSQIDPSFKINGKIPTTFDFREFYPDFNTKNGFLHEVHLYDNPSRKENSKSRLYVILSTSKGCLNERTDLFIHPDLYIDQ